MSAEILRRWWSIPRGLTRWGGADGSGSLSLLAEALRPEQSTAPRSKLHTEVALKAHNRESQATMNPERSLEFLRAGNERFVSNLRTHRNLLEQVNETREGQFPFATVLSCIDSRTSAELIFDQGLGDIFSIRIAGSVVNEDILGSMEFSCKVAGSKLIVVLGHNKCGAIKGACDGVQLGNISTLLNKIQPSVYLERTIRTNRTSANEAFVERVNRIQVRRSVDAIVERSPVLREMIVAGEVGLIGGIYSIDDGSVQFLEDTWMCRTIRHFYLDPAAEGETPMHERRLAK